MVKNKTVPGIITAFILLLFLSTILVPKALAFGSNEHEAITDEILEKIGFSDDARKEVTNANLAQDSIICYGPLCPGISNTEIPEYHGDRLPGETSLQAFNRLRNFINKARSWIKSNLTKCDTHKAWVALGQALHALQDFYSHSNFVDKGVFTEEEKAEIKKALDDPSYNPEALEKLKMTGWGMRVKDDPEKYHHDEKNKDTSGCPLGRDTYENAVSAAGAHTYDFLRKLKNELSDEEWNKLTGKKPLCKPSKPPPLVKERKIEEGAWDPALELQDPRLEYTGLLGYFKGRIHYESNWTTSLIVLEGLPNGVMFLSSNSEPSLLYTATIRYKVNKYGFSEGLVETDEGELPSDMPVEAEE